MASSFVDLRLAIAATCGTLALTAGHAAAVPVVSTSATYYADGSVADTATQAPGEAAPARSSAGGNSGGASAYAGADGILNVLAEAGGSTAVAMMAAFAFPAPSGPFSSYSFATWEDVVTNNTGQQIDYRYIFHVFNPRVSTQGNEGDYAGLALRVLLDGAVVWSASVEMDRCTLSYSGSIAPPINHFGCSAYFGSFDAAVPLGTFAAGDTFRITYEMAAFANSGGGGDNNHVFAGVGDPFALAGAPIQQPSGNPVQVIARPVDATVPEPASLALLGLGVAALGLGRRGRR